MPARGFFPKTLRESLLSADIICMAKQPARKKRSTGTGTKRRKKKSKGFRLGSSFWILLILLIGIVFYIFHDELGNVISNNKYLSRFMKEDKPLVVEDIETPESKRGTASAEKNIPKKETPKDTGKDTIIKMGNQVVSSEKDKQAPKKQEMPKQIQSTIRDSALFFVFISESGDIKLSKINRKVQVSGSPLQAVIEVLLDGLNADELNQGYLSLIPDGTKLKSIRVSDGIATMDFSEEFMFNTFGSEGMKTQLKQIIYTASEFPTVRAVQFLIDGKKVSYMSESIYTEKPLSKDSF